MSKKERIKEEFNEPCRICDDSINLKTDIIIKLDCNHIFHNECVKTNEKISKDRSCPLCRKNYYCKLDKFIINQKKINELFPKRSSRLKNKAENSLK